MKSARIIGRIFCTRQDAALDGKKLLLIQPMDWETGKDEGGQHGRGVEGAHLVS